MSFFLIGLGAITVFSDLLFSTVKHTRSLLVCTLLLVVLDFLIRITLMTYIILITLGIALVYMLFLYIRAMYRKVPGSYFLGIGIGFTALFLLVMSLFAIRKDINITIGSGNISTVVFIFCCCLSVLAVPISISAFLAWRSRMAQCQLNDRTEQLRQKNDALRAIAQMQSHDIRQPLTSLMGLINLADDEVLKLDKEWLTMARNAADVLDQKIHSIVNESMGYQDLKLHHFNKMVEDIEDYAILLLDTDGTIENWNKGAEKVYGYVAGEVVGKKFTIFHTHDQQRDGLPERLLAIATKEGSSRDQGVRLKKNGEKMITKVVITAIRNDANETIGFTNITRKLGHARRWRGGRAE